MGPKYFPCTQSVSVYEPLFLQKKNSLSLSHLVLEIEPPTKKGEVHPTSPRMSIRGNIPDENKTNTNFAKQLFEKMSTKICVWRGVEVVVHK